jgi:hypothetical protein
MHKFPEFLYRSDAICLENPKNLKWPAIPPRKEGKFALPNGLHLMYSPLVGCSLRSGGQPLFIWATPQGHSRRSDH